MTPKFIVVKPFSILLAGDELTFNPDTEYYTFESHTEEPNEQGYRDRYIQLGPKTVRQYHLAGYLQLPQVKSNIVKAVDTDCDCSCNIECATHKLLDSATVEIQRLSALNKDLKVAIDAANDEIEHLKTDLYEHNKLIEGMFNTTFEYMQNMRKLVK
jgi:hypothetical protein